MMQKRVFHVRVAAIFLLIGVLGSWGCDGGGQKKAEAPTKGGVPASVLTEVPAVAFTAPAAPAIASSDIIGYAKVRDPQKFIDRLGAWASLFPIPMTPEMLRTQLEQSGVNLADLRAGGNVALFVFNPGPALAGGVPIAALVPATDGSSIAQAMRAQLGETNVQAVGNSLLFAQDIDTMTRAQALADALAKTSDASMASDIQIYVNMDTVMKQYGAMARGYIPMFKQMMAMAQGMPPEQLAQAQQNVETLMTALLDFLDQVQGVTLLVDLGDTELELATVVTAKPDTALAGMLSAQPLTAPDLARFLPTPSIMRAQMTYSDMKGMMSWWVKFMEKMLPPNSGVDLAKVEQEFSGLDNIGRVDYAVGAGMNPDGTLGAQGILHMADTAPMMKFIQEKITSVNTGVIHDFYKAQGMDISVAEASGSRDIAGHPVHQYKIGLAFDSKMAVTPEQAEIMKKIFGNMQMEVVEISPLIVYSLNIPADSLVQSLLDGKAGASLDASRSYPAGGFVEGDVNFGAYMNAIKTLVPGMQAQGMPNLPDGLPPVMMYGRNTQGEGYYSLKLPRGLVKGFVDAVTGAVQQPQGTPGEQPPTEEPDMAPGI